MRYYRAVNIFFMVALLLTAGCARETQQQPAAATNKALTQEIGQRALEQAQLAPHVQH
jgi:uncharacterized lipoprotein YajG